MENNGSGSIVATERPRLEGYYLSRIQRWCRWHVALQWPLCLQSHVYYKPTYVEDPADVVHEDKDGKVFSFYRGWHFDEDEIYWGDGAGAGNFK